MIIGSDYLNNANPQQLHSFVKNNPEAFLGYFTWKCKNWKQQ